MSNVPIPAVRAAQNLREAMMLLARAGELLPQVEGFTQQAYDMADLALMIAVNEAKLAERDAKEGN